MLLYILILNLYIVIYAKEKNLKANLQVDLIVHWILSALVIFINYENNLFFDKLQFRNVCVSVLQMYTCWKHGWR